MSVATNFIVRNGDFNWVADHRPLSVLWNATNSVAEVEFESEEHAVGIKQWLKDEFNIIIGCTNNFLYLTAQIVLQGYKIAFVPIEVED